MISNDNLTTFKIIAISEIESGIGDYGTAFDMQIFLCLMFAERESADVISRASSIFGTLNIIYLANCCITA